jgi:hypothetical protein
MSIISANTTITVPAGALLLFKAGGIARAIDDAGNVYQIGLNDMIMGPYVKAQTVEVLVTSGSIEYVVDTDGDASDVVKFDRYSNTITDPASLDAVRGAIRSGTTAGAQRAFGAPGSTATVGFSITTQHPAEAPFFAVQPIYANWSASAYAVTAAKVAASPTHLNNGLSLTFSSVTFPSSNSVPAALSGSGNDIVPGLLAANVIPLTSLSRTDTPANKPLIQHRIYSADAQSAISGIDMASYNANSGGRQYGQRVTSGDQVSTITDQAPVESATGWVQPAVLRFFYSVPCVTIGVVGDSLDRGQGSTGNVLGWPQRACASLTTDLGVYQCMNFAWSGQTHTATANMAKQVISTVKPDVLCIASWSPNDTAATQAIMDRCWAETLEIIELCRRNGIKCVVRTCGPVNAYSAADDARIKAQNARTRLLSGAGVAVLDHAAVLEDPANPRQILATYDSGDGVHYSNAGYSALAVADAPVIASLL